LRPSLIVIDARSRGCSGTPSEALPMSPDPMLRIVDHASVEQTVAELATCSRYPPRHAATLRS
jgi:hypothetical protein